MKNQKNTSSFRYQIGISQDHMALWLGVSRSNYSMHEINKRCMPYVPLSKYFQLEAEWKKFEQEWTDPGIPEAEDYTSDILSKIETLERQLGKTRYELKKLNQLPHYQKARAFFEHLLSKTEDPKEQVVFRLQILNLEKLWKQTQKNKNALTIELALMEKQLEVLQKAIAPENPD
jgi:DNA-binding XRE family transcriptional regulator